ncbi:YigZ family protein [Loigolactobacillus jiayinensis]|uniref:YigZ family protein n=1 Tax=Loigolactobacillus jiayinensis TaxID=2486016 RepID=A0ABW1RCG2_9LACO|nr:YigZ family protein [Loigolactobacillus jiayinensis]
MLTHYITIKAAGEHEIEIKKSRFICQLARADSETDAQAFIAACKKKHYKANHSCSAYVIGEHDEHQHAHDDGEPAGTAGVPMLEVLRRQHLKNVVAVTTRYFGGTKLGAGGLIRAYSNSVSQALTEIGLVEGRLQKTVIITIDYAQIGSLEHYLQQQAIAIAAASYLEKVALTIMVTESDVPAVQAAIIELLSGQVTFEFGAEQYSETILKNTADQ